MASIVDRVRNSVNAFLRADTQPEKYRQDYEHGGYTSYGSRPDRPIRRMIQDRSIISSVYTRLSIDVASIPIEHVRVDEEGRFESSIKSGLNDCLTVEANIDQAARHFRQDVALTLFEKGVVALVPVDTTDDPDKTESYDIITMRVGEIVTWYPYHVRVSVWNERLGRHEEVIMAKKNVAIVENPFYQVMNEPNGTLQRLLQKLAYLDANDAKTSASKLDLIIQLPYTIRDDQRREQAEQRRQDIEMQLTGSTHGIAFSDATEKITQLNRSVENNLLPQVEALTKQLFAQLGLAESVFDGTADEATMLNYRNRTLEPIVTAIAEAIKRTFLSKTARTQGQSIEFMMDPFRLVPLSDLAELGDKLLRNSILTANEFRAIIGYRPIKDGKSDQLTNPNMPEDKSPQPTPDSADTPEPSGDPTDSKDGEATFHSELMRVRDEYKAAKENVKLRFQNQT